MRRKFPAPRPSAGALLPAAILLMSLAASAPLPAQSPWKPGGPSVDLFRMKTECGQFETALDAAIRQAIPHPMFLTERTQGAYVENYGVMFQLTVNLGRGFILFAGTQPMARDGKAVATENRRTLAQLKQSLLYTLWQNGNAISQLSSNARICIITHVLNLPTGRDDSPKRVMILTVQKSDLANGGSGQRPTFEEFKRRVKFIDY